MPLEGHYRRQNTPLRSLQARERRILAIVVAVIVAGCIAAVVASVSTGGEKPTPHGCVAISLAGVMGAAVQQHCGDQARFVCAHPEGQGGPAYVRLVREACHKAGIATD